MRWAFKLLGAWPGLLRLLLELGPSMAGAGLVLGPKFGLGPWAQSKEKVKTKIQIIMKIIKIQIQI